MQKIHETVKEIIDILKARRQSVTFAESCTGGGVAATFTAVPGASAVFNGSVVTYANEIKHRWLGVSEEVLATYGAVSEECVSQMLDGVKKLVQADYAVAISGIAGPDGGTPQKPVGTVYIGLLTPDFKEVEHHIFDGNREAIQRQSIARALTRLRSRL